MRGMLGTKVGMTRVYDAQGRQVPVTVIAAGPCVVVQRKTAATDGYESVQVGFSAQKPARMTKASVGHQKQTAVQPMRVLKEFDLDAGEDLKPGDQVTVKNFEGVSHIDVIATTKGRGFQGVVKRHRMGGGPNTHGHMSHRRIGAIGQRTWPARIQKNKRMPGHMGHVRVTVQNIEVVQVRPEDHAILVRGAVPGPNGATIVLRKAIKKSAKAST